MLAFIGRRLMVPLPCFDAVMKLGDQHCRCRDKLNLSAPAKEEGERDEDQAKSLGHSPHAESQPNAVTCGSY
jgi:hypothetical protein